MQALSVMQRAAKQCGNVITSQEGLLPPNIMDKVSDLMTLRYWIKLCDAAVNE